MLTLERHEGEALEITTPDGVVIVVKLVTIVSNTKVEIGIEAPREYKISRVEN